MLFTREKASQVCRRRPSCRLCTGGNPVRHGRSPHPVDSHSAVHDAIPRRSRLDCVRLRRDSRPMDQRLVGAQASASCCCGFVGCLRFITCRRNCRRGNVVSEYRQRRCDYSGGVIREWLGCMVCLRVGKVRVSVGRSFARGMKPFAWREAIYGRDKKA